MPEIYCLGAPTPSLVARVDGGRGKEEARERERKKEAEERGEAEEDDDDDEEEVQKKEDAKVAKLAHPSFYIWLCDEEQACATEN